AHGAQAVTCAEDSRWQSPAHRLLTYSGEREIETLVVTGNGGPEPGRRLQGQSQARTEASLWLLKAASVAEVEDQGTGPSPRPKTLIWPASQPTKGPPWLGTTSGQEGRWRLAVSAAIYKGEMFTIIAVTKLRNGITQGAKAQIEKLGLFASACKDILCGTEHRAVSSG
ncbi:hypothetical protein KUCAC02_000880, partial [Chaenocephalus aceratus]